MAALGLLSVRLFPFFFFLVSFWPWEADQGQIKKTSLEIPRKSDSARLLRVALFFEKPQIEVQIPGPYKVETVPGNQPLAEGSGLAETSVRSHPSGIWVGKNLYRVSGLRISTGQKDVQVGNRKYHNNIQVLKNPAGSLTVVNEVDVEDYLKGVLPLEMNADWPAEALKAQAVVSRTYAVFKNLENREFPFTLSSDTGSQVYGGKSREKFSTSKAVRGTRGQILTYNSRIFPTYFHSTCGGATTQADYQWKVESHPSLKGVECQFCRESKFYEWSFEFPVSELEGQLRKKYSVSGLKAILPDRLDASGRARHFVVQHGGGSLTIPGNDFRLLVGADRMRSTRVKIQRSGGRFIFQGRGWGHGVGMCQYGAKRLAELGYGYQDILRYYFPQSEVQNLEDSLSFARAETPENQGGTAEGNEDGIFHHWYQKVKNYVEDL